MIFGFDGVVGTTVFGLTCLKPRRERERGLFWSCIHGGLTKGDLNTSLISQLFDRGCCCCPHACPHAFPPPISFSSFVSVAREPALDVRSTIPKARAF